MYPKLFKVINTYGLLIGIGIIVCLWVFHTFAKKKNIEDKFIDFVEWLAIIAIIFGVVAAAAVQNLYNYIADPSLGFDSSLGAFIGIVIDVVLIIVIVIFQFTYKKFNIDEEKKDKIDKILVDLVALGIIAPTIIISLVNYYTGKTDVIDIGTGLTFLGGLIGGVAAFLVVYFWKRKYFKSKIMDILSIAPCCITVAHAFGRLGCFCAGCCYGIESGTWLDMSFPVWSDSWEIIGYHKHLPTQLYESIFLFIIFGVMSFMLLKKDFKYNMPVYLVSYGVWRFLIEFIRGDERGSFIGNISPSQFWSIIMALIGIGLIFAIRYVFKKREEALKE